MTALDTPTATVATRMRGNSSPRMPVNVLVFIFVICGAIAIVEPSPYDFASMIAIPGWFIFGFRVHRMFAPFFVLMTVYLLSGFLALTPYWDDHDAVMFELQSFYLYFTSLFFALYVGERTLERAELVLKAFTVSNLVAASAAILGYFNVAGSADYFMVYERASGTFKDPNVLGSFVVMGALYLIQLIMLNRTRHRIVTLAVLAPILMGLFLSFSRGSWAAFIVATGMMVGMGFLTAGSRRLRLNIVFGMIAIAIVAAIILAALLSDDAIRTLLLQRSQAPGEEYDDPRFFNQLRSLPMLLERPLGFGPLRFRLIFDLEPHSSFVNGFASFGWLGGCVFIILVCATVYIGFRLCLLKSPFRTLAQVYWPALFVFFVQGFQIDIDHWRHVFLMLGAIWGLEAARQRWQSQQDRDSSKMASATAARAFAA